MTFPQITPAVLATALAMVCVAGGARVERVADGAAGRGRILVAVSGAVLLCIAVLGIGPELVRGIGWLRAAGLAAAAYIALSLLDQHGHPVCPSCSHGDCCPGEAFAVSLTIATAVHAFLDGWGLSVVRSSATGAVPGAVFGAILLHKVPEGLALGAMLRASTLSLATVLALAAAAESMTVGGGILGLWTAPAGWVDYLLAAAMGVFIFLGIHALRGTKQHGSGVRESSRLN